MRGAINRSSSPLAIRGSGCSDAQRQKNTTLAYWVHVLAPGAPPVAPGRFSPSCSFTRTSSTSGQLPSGCPSPTTKRARTADGSAPTHVQRRSVRRRISPLIKPSSSSGRTGSTSGNFHALVAGRGLMACSLSSSSSCPLNMSTRFVPRTCSATVPTPADANASTSAVPAPERKPDGTRCNLDVLHDAYQLQSLKTSEIDTKRQRRQWLHRSRHQAAAVAQPWWVDTAGIAHDPLRPRLQLPASVVGSQ